MPDSPWKRTEREAAAMVGGARYWANAGQAVDVESSWCVAQVKHVKTCSLAQLEALALEADRQGQQRQKIGVVVVRRRAGRGVSTPRLVVLTEAMWRAMSGRLPGPVAG